MEKTKKTVGVADIVMVGLFSALVFAASWLQISIPTPLGNTRIHLGNVLCLLSGFMLGALRGGLAAGVGSMLFDFTNPLYIASAPFTLVFKFIMGFLCGLVGSRVRDAEKVKYRVLNAETGALAFNVTKKQNDFVYKVAAAVTGQFTYIILYLGKGYYWDALTVQKSSPEAAWIDVIVGKAPVSLFNGLLAVIISVPLAIALQKALKGVPLMKRLRKG